MNELETLLAKNVGKRTLFMCHMIAGYPTQAKSEVVAKALVAGGADILEVQIPFSDPMADGPTIAAACRDALSLGASVKKTLALVAKLSRGDAPVVIMSYINPVFRYGIEKFVRDAAKAGVTGLIIPDAPFDTPEGRELIAAARNHGLCMIPVVTPGVPMHRLKDLGRDASGFVYCTSRQGTTGANSKFAQNLKAYFNDLRKTTKLPIGLGFGVRTRQDFRDAAQLADIVIAGSVFVNAVRENADIAKSTKEIRG